MKQFKCLFLCCLLLLMTASQTLASAGQTGLSAEGSTPWQSGTSKEDGTDN